MKFTTLLTFLLIACYGFQCEKDNAGNCTALHDALISKDESVIEVEINAMLGDLMPNPVAGDLVGHEINLGIFIDRLKDNCGFDASLGCYACIETFPVQSEVYISLDSLGTTVVRVMDILTPDSVAMTFRGLH